MQIDPQGWWVTAPMMVAMLWAYFQPADHAVKAFVRNLIRSESQGFASLTGYELWGDETRAVRAYRRLFWGVVVALSLATASSIGAWVGLLPAA